MVTSNIQRDKMYMIVKIISTTSNCVFLNHVLDELAIICRLATSNNRS